MYLALRFGPVGESTQTMTSLPVIVDDTPVDRDPRRASVAAKGLASLVDTDQVPVFDRHLALAEQFQEASLAAAVHNQGSSSEIKMKVSQYNRGEPFNTWFPRQPEMIVPARAHEPGMPDPGARSGTGSGGMSPAMAFSCLGSNPFSRTSS